MKCLCAAAVAAALTPGLALAVDYDEADGGDLSDDRFDTSQFTLDLGANNFRMTVINAADFENGDIDYLTLTIPTALQLDSVVLNEASAANEGDNRAFIGLAMGEDFPVDPMAPDPSPLEGFVITGDLLVGQNILPELRSGDTSPIPGESTWSLWIQQTGTDLTQLDLTFNVSEIPAPGAAALFGLAGLAASRRRR